MAQVIAFPNRRPQPGKPDPSHLMKSAAVVAVVAVQSGLDRRTAADALRRVAAALERRS